MTRVVLVDHYDSYTHNLAHLIASVTGTLPAVVEHDAVDVEQLLDGSYTHVVLSPGPGHPEQPADFAVGDAVFRAGLLPVLGVCLGMQGLVTCYGGRVEPVEPAHGEVSRLVHSGRGLFEGVPQDLAVVRYLCDRVMVMYKGRLLETAPTEQLWAAPVTDYARTLLGRGAAA